MLTFDSVKLRLEREQPLTFLEFNYMILQAYDFRELALRHGCRLQMGGSDQWGNIVNGIELTRRMEGDRAVRRHHAAADHGRRRQDGQDRRGRGLAQRGAAARPMISGNTGATPTTATSARFLRLFTDLPLDEIARLEALEGSEINAAKIVLANEVTRLCRGDEAATRGRGHGVRNVRRWRRRAQTCRCSTVPADGMRHRRRAGRHRLRGQPGRGQATDCGGGARIDGEAVTDEAHRISRRCGELRISVGQEETRRPAPRPDLIRQLAGIPPVYPIFAIFRASMTCRNPRTKEKPWQWAQEHN